MKISKIRWKNFRPFNTEMELANDEQVILVNWVNGTGKTSFLNSIAWCLTGREIFTSDRYMPNGHAVKASFNSGDPIKVEVEIVFRSKDGLATIVTRAQEFRAQSLDSVIDLNQSKVTIQREDPDKGYTTMGPTESLQWLQENFPPTLIDNFLVNGQKWGSDRKAKKGAVEAIARIDAFTNVIDHLVSLERDLSVEAKPPASASDRKKRLSELVAEAENALEAFNQAVRDAQLTVDDFERENGPIQDWWDALADAGGVKQQVEGYRREISQAREEERTLKESIADSLSIAIPSALLSSEITELGELFIDDLSRTAPKWLIEEVLSSETCICGRSVAGHESALKELEQRSPESSFAEYFGLTRGSIDITRTTGFQASGTLREQFKALRTAGVKKSNAEAELKNLTSTKQLSEIEAYPDIETATPVYLELKKKEAVLDSAPSKRQELTGKLNELRGQLESDDEGLTPKAKKSRALAKFARSCIEAAEFIRNDTIQGVRSKVAEEFERIFRSISSDDELSWKHFELDEHFDIRIVDHDGQDRRKGFSAGKELSLAFSFALALGRIAGYELPLIADTPFGPMSKDVKVATVGGIRAEIGHGGASESRQMFLLMTDEEFSSKVQQAFDELKPTVFLGTYDQETQETEIRRAEVS